MCVKMASIRSWKLQEFVAHNANVNCLALGHKSGRVMVTGGDDKKVNLWAVGKQSCFMSLSGHTTPVECVQFNHVEELVCAGSRAGALKVWDLEAAKLVRTLTGHRDSIKCVDFHPYGDLLASGSADCVIKVWDSRKKGCLFTYPGHKARVNCLKFSPDGQWIASCGEDCTIKIWDLRVGRVLKEFRQHNKAVTCVEFHPHEFLLATGATDHSVNFFDLENFNLVSSEWDLGSVKCMCFNPDGECLFTGVRDYLKVVGWEPNRLYDSVPTNWGRICDISTAQNQLVGASFHLTNVTIHVVNLKKVHPIGGTTAANDAPSPFTPNQSIRKSFSRAERPVGLKTKSTIDVKTIEESTSGTDPEEESSADITNIKDYNEIFKGKALLRTPPPEPEPFVEPATTYFDPAEPQKLAEIQSFEALSLDDSLSYHQTSSPNPTTYTRSKSNLDQIFSSRNTKPERGNETAPSNKQKVQQKNNLLRQNSKENAEKNHRNNFIKHSASDANISKSSNLSARITVRKNSFSKPSRNSSSVPNVNLSKIPLNSSRNVERTVPKAIPIITNTPVDIYVSPKLSPDDDVKDEDFVPVTIDRPVGLDLDDFLPKSHQTFQFQRQRSQMSETEVLGIVIRGHDQMMAVLATRQRGLKVVFAQFRSKDIKAALDTAIAFNDLSVIVDVLSVINFKYTLWNLDLCVIVLPKIEELLQSKFESYITRGCDSLRLILKHFAPVIKNNIQSPVGSFGVDISREERYRKSLKCHENLVSIQSVLLKKQSVPGALGNCIKELQSLLKMAFD